MKLRGNLAVLNNDGRRLTGVWGAVQKDHVRIRGWVSTERPSDVDANDHNAVGIWTARALKEAGCTTKQCVIAVPRASVVLKRLSFPMLGEGADGDLAGMVHLQMARQLTMPLHGAALDFVRLQPSDSRESTEVLAAALPGEHVAACRTIAKHAKLRLRSVALRGEGSAALFAQLSYTQDGPVLGVSLTPQGVELGVVAEGRVVFSRAIDLKAPTGVEDWQQFADEVVVEAKRTRMGYRGAGESRDLVCVAVLGDDSLAGSVGKALGEGLDLPWEAVKFPNAVEIPSDMDGSVRAGLAPLIGLMLGAAINRPTYDFANPRKAPDTAASIRQAALAGALGLIICGGGGWVIADQQLRALDTKVEETGGEAMTYADRVLRQLRAEARISHIEKLHEPGVDWVSHLEYLSSSIPPPDLARIESIDGSIQSGVGFLTTDEDGQPVPAASLEKGQWTKTSRVELTVAGAAARAVSDTLRDNLVASAVYTTATQGPDEPDRFEYKLTSTAVRPKDVAAEEAAPNASEGES